MVSVFILVIALAFCGCGSKQSGSVEQGSADAQAAGSATAAHPEVEYLAGVLSADAESAAALKETLTKEYNDYNWEVKSAEEFGVPGGAWGDDGYLVYCSFSDGDAANTAAYEVKDAAVYSATKNPDGSFSIVGDE
jgi:hypothetical protein